jgi:hypothetical protein
LAETFNSPEEQEAALAEIGSFKQSIQLEIIKRSGGNLDKISELKEEAMEGAFNTITCRDGLCPIMSHELKAQIKKILVKNKDEEISTEILLKELKKV